MPESLDILLLIMVSTIVIDIVGLMLKKYVKWRKMPK
jgi:hypothetical protein